MTTRPVAVKVSQATRLKGSSARQASRIASEIWSAILSGCPSVTDSDVNKNRSCCGKAASSAFLIAQRARLSSCEPFKTVSEGNQRGKTLFQRHCRIEVTRVLIRGDCCRGTGHMLRRTERDFLVNIAPHEPTETGHQQQQQPD